MAFIKFLKYALVTTLAFFSQHIRADSSTPEQVCSYKGLVDMHIDNTYPFKQSVMMINSAWPQCWDGLMAMVSVEWERICGNKSSVPAKCVDSLADQLRGHLDRTCRMDREYFADSPPTDGCLPPLPIETVPPDASDALWWPSTGGPSLLPSLGSGGQVVPRGTWETLEQLRAVIASRRTGRHWGVYYADMADYVRAVDSLSPVVVELGTCFGGLGNHVLGELRKDKIVNWYAVDPFWPDYDEEDATSDILATLAKEFSLGAVDFSWAYGLALARDQHTLRHGCRYHQLRTTSIDASRYFADESVDVVFVDGLHTYGGVASDIIAWLPKLRRKTGSFVFNDYGLMHFPGVTFAVDDFMRSHQSYEMELGDFGKPPGMGNLAVFIADTDAARYDDDRHHADGIAPRFCVENSPITLLSQPPVRCEEHLNFDQPKLQYFSQKQTVYLIGAAGSGPSKLAVAQRCFKEGTTDTQADIGSDFVAGQSSIFDNVRYDGICPRQGIYVLADPAVALRHIYHFSDASQRANEIQNGKNTLGSGHSSSSSSSNGRTYPLHSMLRQHWKGHMEGWMHCDSLLAVTTDDITRYKDVLARHLNISVENFAELAVTMTEGPADDDYEHPEDSNYFEEIRRELVSLANEHNKRVLSATDAARLEYKLNDGGGAATSRGGASGEEVERLLSEREQMERMIMDLRLENAKLLRAQEDQARQQQEASSTSWDGSDMGSDWA